MGLECCPPCLRSRTLPRSRRTKIFKAIEGVGLNPDDFKFEDKDAAVRLKHRWSESYFSFGGDDGHYVGRYVAGDLPDWPYEEYSWETLMTRVSSWLRDVKLDLDTPDLWAEMQGEAELLGGTSGEANDNTPFTPEEQKEIELRLREVEQRVKEAYSLSAEQMTALNVKIDYLVDAVGRLGRNDWRNIFVGAIFSYVLNAGLSSESARSMFWTFMTLLRVIGHLFGHGFPELPTGGA
jgi:hypothetical protein